ncbi:Transposon TX1 uncharacterized 149 kDa protein [Linum perenne]
MKDLYSNLRRVKEALKELNTSLFSCLSKRVKDAEKEMTKAQSCALRNNDPIAVQKLRAETENWKYLKGLEEMFYKQKARITSITEGDPNTKYFHNKMKTRNVKKQITQLTSSKGEQLMDIGQISAEIVSFIYKRLLGEADVNVRDLPQSYFNSLVINKLADADQVSLSKQIDGKEVKNSIFAMKGDKSPGSDGFNAFFFQHSWTVVGELVTQAVQEFFAVGVLSSQVNATILSPIPKVPSACRMVDFRPSPAAIRCISVSQRL